MDIKELAEFRRKGNMKAIIEYAGENTPEQIDDPDVRMLIAEAYLNIGELNTSIRWYESCFDVLPEECARQLLYIYKNTNNTELLNNLSEQIEEAGLSPGLNALCRYEILRCSDGSIEDRMEALEEYVEEEYDAWYMLRLSELFVLNHNKKSAVRQLRQCVRLFPNTEYSDYAERMLDSIEKEDELNLIGQSPVESNIYCKLKQKTEETRTIVKNTTELMEKKTEKKDFEQAKQIQTTSLSEQMRKKTRKKRKYINTEPMSVEDRFKDIYGMKDIRDELGNLYRILRMESERKENDLQTSVLKSTHFTISGGKGTGKTMLATTIGQLLYDFGIRENEKAVLIEARDLQNSFENLNQLKDVTLIIENIEKCADDDFNFDQDSIVWPLRNLMIEHKDDISVIITGCRQGIDHLFEKEREVKKYICKKFEIKTYEPDELLDIAILIAKKRQFYFDDEAKLLIRKILRKRSIKKNFECAYEVDELITDAIAHMANRLDAMDNYNEIDMVTLKKEDFEKDNRDDEKVVELLGRIDQMIGLSSVKNKVKEKINEVRINQEKEENGIQVKYTSRHLVFYGNPGTGKTTVARIIGEIYYYLGLLPEKKMVECSVSDLVADHVGGTSLKTRNKVESAIGGVLFIDEAYMLADSKSQFNADAVTEILKGMEDHRDELMVIMAGYKSAMDDFFKDTNQGLKGRFPAQNRIEFDDYTETELVQIFKEYTKEAGLRLEEDADSLLLLLMNEKSREDGFDNARGVRNVFEEVYTKMGYRLDQIGQKTKEDYQLIKKEDIENVLGKAIDREMDQKDCLNELYKLTGLSSVKKEISDIIMEIEADKLYGENGRIGIENYLFLGNPGTGKTTVARILGGILEKLGVLEKKNHFVECTREDFVSKIVGESGEKTKKLVESAYGGILFIDEAYRLYEGDNDTYGKEAVETLMKIMEDNRDKLVVIAAGYTKEMHDFLKVNPGLCSRFTKEIIFEDYSEDELLSILMQMCRPFILEKSCEGILLTYFRNLRIKPHFGNSREMRTLSGNLIKNVKIRNLKLNRSGITSDTDLMHTIVREDVEIICGSKYSQKDTLDELLAELDNLIGLTNVKKDIHNLVRFIQGVRRVKGEDVDLAKELDRMHMVFQGSPGTGKTTVARIIGKIYQKLGILKRDVFVECDSSGLIGQYVGETEQKTNQKIDEAMGGVLFIDEAYALAGSGNDYGQKAVNVLLKRMEDNRHDFLVILAGYTDEMKRLFEMNDGFASRVPNIFTFENYSNDELLKILIARHLNSFQK